MSRLKLKLLALSSLTALLVSPLAAAAQSEETTEVVVRATRKAELVSKSPQSISIIRGKLPAALEMYDLKALQSLTPSLLMTSTANEAQSTARLRGVGTVGDNPGLESSVGVMIDGVMRARTATGLSDLGPISHIEVLKGPQSGAYGKGASAGLIAVTSKAPSGLNQTELSLSAGSDDIRGLRFYQEGALRPDIAASVFFGHTSRQGQYEIKTGEGPRGKKSSELRDNDQNSTTLRAQLASLDQKKLSWRLIFDATRRDENCCAGTALTIGGTRPYIDQLASDEGTALTIDPKARKAWLNRSSRQVIEDGGLSLELGYQLSERLRLVSLSAARTYDHVSGYDADFTSADIYYRDPDGSFGNRFVTLSQELRLEGYNNRLSYYAGLLVDQENLRRKDQYLYGPDYEPYMGLLLSGGKNIAHISSLTGLPVGQSFRSGEGARDIHEQTTNNWALFAGGDVSFTRRLTLRSSLRYHAQAKSLTSHYVTTDAGNACQNAQSLGSSGLGVVCLPWSNPAFKDKTLTQDNDSDAFTGSLTLHYQIYRLLAYAGYSSGFKGAGFNLDREQLPSFALDGDTGFKSERSQALEAGVKWRFHDGFIGFAAYDQSFKNFQLNSFIGTTFLVRSVPHLRSQGFELEGQKSFETALGVLELDAGVAQNISRFGPEPVAGLALLANNRPSFAPKWSAVTTASLSQEFGRYRLKSTLNGRFNSDYNTGSDLLPIKQQKSYLLLNGAVALSDEQAGWEVSLWGQNLSDELYHQVIFSAPFQSGTFNSFTGLPRSLGVRLKIKR